MLQYFIVLAHSLEVWTCSVLLYEFSLIFEHFLYWFLWEMSYGHWDFLLNSLFYSSIIPSLLLQDFPGPFPDSQRSHKTRTKYYTPRSRFGYFDIRQKIPNFIGCISILESEFSRFYWKNKLRKIIDDVLLFSENLCYFHKKCMHRCAFTYVFFVAVHVSYRCPFLKKWIRCNRKGISHTQIETKNKQLHISFLES